MFLSETLIWLIEHGWLMLLHLSAKSSFPKPLPPEEERALIADIGDAGARLHTGRSRNDQVALDNRLVARRFAELRDEHGGEALAAFACSRSTNEDIYLFQKMARISLHTNNVDCCARV